MQTWTEAAVEGEPGALADHSDADIVKEDTERRRVRAGMTHDPGNGPESEATGCCCGWSGYRQRRPQPWGETGACPFGEDTTPGNEGIFAGVGSTIHSEPDRSNDQRSLFTVPRSGTRCAEVLRRIGQRRNPILIA
jgi:hypothetical protein